MYVMFHGVIFDVYGLIRQRKMYRISTAPSLFDDMDGWFVIVIWNARSLVDSRMVCNKLDYGKMKKNI